MKEKEKNAKDDGFVEEVTLGEIHPLQLSSGGTLSPFKIAYKSWGKLNSDKSNAILVCHALTGDQYARGKNPLTGKDGWWPKMIGPGLPIDTNKYFVICTNVLGSCSGTSGPKEINTKTNEPYGLDFPVITIADMVSAQVMLVNYLKIDQLFSVIGGSMGGMQVLQWAVNHSARVRTAIPIASTWRHSAQNIAFHEVGRQAIMADPNWSKGRYFENDNGPHAGLSVARMAAHITYMSERSLTAKFGRNLQDREKLTFGFDADFQVESYLRYQGISFVDRFDANSYLYITRAMDYFDISADYGGNLSKAFENTPVKFCIMSFTSDWLYTTQESREIVRALNAVGAQVSFVEIDMEKGHDSFLLDCPEMFNIIAGFLAAEAGK
ncbi:MAG: homoserine O-acetyltransferase [Emcibacteraceae bacterium]|jgi:homoserine O-acetyltransferase|nr:homoserine O-acetyltransferase [Kordiimonadaceae bacterium]MDC0082506.1 homoserine O-acetyltransferase [Emcibacteraceae bacterium]MBT6135756.1 homoserine O-acetyltransferase [Kordiimonadaceae bacterium]MBT6466831.1 homoserine O-acetyltransferase [Kordiimonadaceae bacterium]MDC0111555.1 homoserine O-acetyltransferase [Emcibacteraceae bacterium]|tara:strand:- start:18390 stop:19532 length:1143 start_codon:yes stop_codon:yes gene_type:complete